MGTTAAINDIAMLPIRTGGKTDIRIATGTWKFALPIQAATATPIANPSTAPAAPSATTGTPLAGPAADRAREALDHYNQAMERLKSGDWAGFGTELDAMRGLLEDMSRQSGGH